MFKNMSVASKIILGFALLIVLMIFVGITGLVGLNKQHAVVSDLLHGNLNYGLQLIHTRQQVGDLRRYEKDMFLNFSDAKKVDEYNDKWQKSLSEAQSALTEAKKLATPEQQAKIDSLSASMAIYSDGKNTVLAQIKSGTFTSSSEINHAFGKYKEPIRNMSDTLSELADAAVKDVIAIEGKVDEIKAEKTQISLILMLLASATGAVCAFVIYQNIRPPLSKMQETIGEIDRTGNIALRLSIKNNDEIGKTSTAMNQLLGNMCEVIGVANRCSSDLVNAAQELNNAANEVSQSSEMQSEASASTAAAVEQMTVSVHMIADNAQLLESETRLAAKTATDGNETAQKTTAKIKQIADSINQSNALIGQLNHRSDEIGSIVMVIKDIADQTNLLALNAAIEAARAGDLGRGFAVVADEVRKLAERTTQATIEITSKIKAVQQDTGVAAKSMNEASALVDTGVSSTLEMSLALEQIEQLSRRNVDHITSISNAIKEQSSASQEIAQNIERIAQAGEENNSAAASTCGLAVRLNELAGRLDTTIHRFKT